MSQSNVIAGSIFIAFIVFITVKGELPSYINLLKGNVNTAGNNVTSVTAPSVGNLIDSTNALEKEVQQDLNSFDSGINISGYAPAVQ